MNRSIPTSHDASNITKIGKDESDDALAHCVHLDFLTIVTHLGQGWALRCVIIYLFFGKSFIRRQTNQTALVTFANI